MGTGAILMHDTENEAVRQAIETVPFRTFPKVAAVDMSFVAGVAANGPLSDGWAGFGLVIIDAERTGLGSEPVIELPKQHDLLRLVRDAKRNARRTAGKSARRLGIHPAQHQWPRVSERLNNRSSPWTSSR
jgi:hypothetical protein